MKVRPPRVLQEAVKGRDVEGRISGIQKASSITKVYNEVRRKLGHGDGLRGCRVVVREVTNCTKEVRNAIFERHGFLRRRVGDRVQVCLDETPRGQRVRNELAPSFAPQSQRATVFEANSKVDISYQSCSVDDLRKACYARLLDPTGDKQKLVKRLMKDDEDLADESGTVLNFCLAKPGSSEGAFVEWKGDEGMGKVVPAVHLRTESYVEKTPSELTLDGILFVNVRNPNIVRSILVSIPGRAGHPSKGRLLLATIHKIAELQNELKSETKGNQSLNFSKSRSKTMELGNDSVHAEEFMQLFEEGESLCEELSHLASYSTRDSARDEFAPDDAELLSVSIAVKQLQRYRFLLCVEEWLYVTPSINCLQYMMSRLENHCKGELDELDQHVQHTRSSVEAKLNRVVSLGLASITGRGVNVADLCCRQDMNADEKLLALLMALIPEQEPGEEAGEGDQSSEDAATREIANRMREVDHESASERMKRQGFIFSELIQLCAQMPPPVLERLLDEFPAQWQEEMAKNKRSKKEMYALVRIMINHTVRTFLQNESKFSVSFKKLQEATATSSLADQPTMKSFEAKACEWWVLRMCRHLIHPYHRRKATGGASNFLRKSPKRASTSPALSRKGTKNLVQDYDSEFMHSHHKLGILHMWSRKVRNENDVERDSDSSSDSDSEREYSGDKPSQSRLDGQLDSKEFEELILNSGGASFGCDRHRMVALFRSMDTCGEGAVDISTLYDITTTFAEVVDDAKEDYEEDRSKGLIENNKPFTLDCIQVYLRTQLLEKEQHARENMLEHQATSAFHCAYSLKNKHAHLPAPGDSPFKQAALRSVTMSVSAAN